MHQSPPNLPNKILLSLIPMTDPSEQPSKSLTASMNYPLEGASSISASSRMRMHPLYRRNRLRGKPHSKAKRNRLKLFKINKKGPKPIVTKHPRRVSRTPWMKDRLEGESSHSSMRNRSVRAISISRNSRRMGHLHLRAPQSLSPLSRESSLRRSKLKWLRSNN